MASGANDTLQVSEIQAEALEREPLLCHFLHKKAQPPEEKAPCPPFLLFSLLDTVVWLGGAATNRGP